MSIQRYFKISDTQQIAFVVQTPVVDRLSGTCFRKLQPGQKLAGNFFRWPMIRNVMYDPDFNSNLLELLKEIVHDQDWGTHSFSITYPRPIGWSSTAPLENYQPDDLEQFFPNQRSRALRVRLDRKLLTAPKTAILTAVVEVRENRGHHLALLHSLYPGEDIGRLAGNITEREKIVFFDWNHQGE